MLWEDLKVGLDRRENVTLEEGEQDEENHRLPKLKECNLTTET